MWCDKWIGANAPRGVTAPCYWLVRSVYRSELGIELPHDGVFAPQDDWGRLIQAGSFQWVHVIDPQDYDVALISMPHQAWHMGLICGERILHLGHRASGAVSQRISIFESREYIRGIYRLKKET